MMKKWIHSLNPKKWFKWHCFPEPEKTNLISIYEIVAYLIIFSFCIYVYKKINEVKYNEEIVEVECFDKERIIETYPELGSWIPLVHISYKMPMTAVSELKNDTLNLTINFGSIHPIDTLGCLKADYALYRDSVRNNFSYNKEQFLEIIEYFKGNNNINKYEALVDLPKDKERYLARKAYFDSIVSSKSIDENRNICNYYFCCKQSIRNKNKALLYSYSKQKENEILDVLENTPYGKDTTYFYDYENYQMEDKYVIQKGIRTGFPYTDVNIPDKYGLSLGDPGWFALEDISQSYFNFKIESYSIDMAYLTIDFCGSTEFSKVFPEPDGITMSSISYTNPVKIGHIKHHGITFHARFKELENRQSIRLFFVTAIMSALFTMFIVFIVLGIYKARISILNYRQELNRNGKDTDDHYFKIQQSLPLADNPNTNKEAEPEGQIE